jgi:hypothetical protein
MNRAALRVFFTGSTLFAGALAGCNLVFGVTGGESAGTGGAVTTSTGSTGGACNVYAGAGDTYFTDLPTANLPTVAMGNDGSVRATYFMTKGFTEIDLGSTVVGYCGIGAQVDLSGMPEPGEYTVVGTSPFTDVTFTQGPGKKAYVFAGANALLPDGGCDDRVLGFGSTGSTGKVIVTSLEGTKLKFTVTGVSAAGISDPACAGMGVSCDGTGTIQIDIKGGEADCYTVQ